MSSEKLIFLKKIEIKRRDSIDWKSAVVYLSLTSRAGKEPTLSGPPNCKKPLKSVECTKNPVDLAAN